MRYEKISFNPAWVAEQSFETFKKHEAHHGLSEAQLKEAYQLCKSVVEAKKEPVKETSRKANNKG